MRKTIIKAITISLTLLITLALFILPVFKVDQDYLFNKYDFLVKDIMENDDPDAAIDHTFTKETFDKAINGEIELNTKYGSIQGTTNWKHNYSGEIIDTESGAKFSRGFKLENSSFSDFVRLALWASGENATITVKVNGKELGTKTLTNNIEKYVFETEEIKEADISINFTGSVTLQRIKVNEDDAATLEVARGILVERMIFFSGIIVNDPSLINVKDKEILGSFDTIEKVLSGINFIDLFNMAIQDLKYDFYHIDLLIKAKQEAKDSVPFSALIDLYKELRLCPFVSILIFIASAAIMCNIMYIVIAFIVDLILKKEKANYKIPSVIILASVMVLLNISTFITPSFFDGTHNVGTEYRLLLFEVINMTPSFIVATILIILLALTTLTDVVLEFVEKTKEKGKNKKIKKTKLITYSVLISSMFVLILLGLIIR